MSDTVRRPRCRPRGGSPVPVGHDRLALVICPPGNSALFATFWRFASERQRVYERRVAGEVGPWTTDPIIARYRFTNVFRASDRVTQYLIREVLYGIGSTAADEVIFRALLFKIFNKTSTWELLSGEGTPRLSDFDPWKAGRLLSLARGRGQRVYSNAYIMPPAPMTDGPKHEGHLRLVVGMLEGGLADRVKRSSGLEDVYWLLRGFPGLGPFLAYQFAIDLAYSRIVDHDEDEYVVAGPGALDGISKIFPGRDLRQAPALIRCLTEEQDLWFQRYDLPFCGLFGRRLHLVDVQNLLCEISKYARVAHPEIPGVSRRTRIKQGFTPAGSAPQPFFPPKWRLRVQRPATAPAAALQDWRSRRADFLAAASASDRSETSP